jgi:REP element-mobilizing transposase RayT
MARPLRIEFAGAIYHVMSRGNARQDVVLDDADREKRLEWLRRTVEIYGWRIHSFVLMRNHDHLFVETPEPNLSAGMQYLNGSYTSYFNRRHRRCGHLFQGRFKGHLIEEQGYFLEVSRYIHLNPVRAKVVARPEQYPWSSYRGYQRASRTVAWVTYDRVLGEFGGSRSVARRAYARFVQAGVEEPPPSPFAEALEGMLLGSDTFVARVRRLLDDRPTDRSVPQLERVRGRPSLEEIVGVVGEHFGVDATLWLPGRRSDDASRAVAAYLARRCFGYPAGEVANVLGYQSGSSITRAVARVEVGNRQLQRTVAKLERSLR